MVTITVEQIEEAPRAFIETLRTEDEILITSGSNVLARVQRAVAPTSNSLYGRLAGKIWISKDFDAPIEEFEIH